MDYEQEFRDLYERDGLAWDNNGEPEIPETQLRGLLEVGYYNLSDDGRCRVFELMKRVLVEVDRLREREGLLSRIEYLLASASTAGPTDTDLLVEEVASGEGTLGGSVLGVNKRADRMESPDE